MGQMRNHNGNFKNSWKGIKIRFSTWKSVECNLRIRDKYSHKKEKRFKNQWSNFSLRDRKRRANKTLIKLKERINKDKHKNQRYLKQILVEINKAKICLFKILIKVKNL